MLPIAITGLVAGGSSIGVGIALVVLAATAESDRRSIMDSFGNAEGACDPAFATDPQCGEIEDLSADERTFRGVGIGLLAGGGAVLGASLVYLLWPRSSTDQAVRVAPSASPRFAGLVIEGSL